VVLAALKIEKKKRAAEATFFKGIHGTHSRGVTPKANATALDYSETMAASRGCGDARGEVVRRIFTSDIVFDRVAQMHRAMIDSYSLCHLLLPVYCCRSGSRL